MELSDYPKHYRCIVADPPWRHELGGTWAAAKGRARPQTYYNTMSLDEIKALDVPATAQCHLYLWCLAWDFTPVVLMTWKKPGLGTGRFRCNTEHFLIARKGSRHGQPFGAGGRTSQATNGTCFEWPRGRHSAKPTEFFALCEKLSVGPRLELFSRRKRDGWDGWGDQYPNIG